VCGSVIGLDRLQMCDGVIFQSPGVLALHTISVLRLSLFSTFVGGPYGRAYWLTLMAPEYLICEERPLVA